MGDQTKKSEVSPQGAQPLPQCTAPPHLRAMDPALLEGTLMWVAGTHVTVLTPVAGVRAANTGHAPGGESGFRNNREGYTALYHPPTRHTKEQVKRAGRKSHSAHQNWTEVGAEQEDPTAHP